MKAPRQAISRSCWKGRGTMLRAVLDASLGTPMGYGDSPPLSSCKEVVIIRWYEEAPWVTSVVETIFTMGPWPSVKQEECQDDEDRPKGRLCDGPLVHSPRGAESRRCGGRRGVGQPCHRAQRLCLVG